jgi:hypothetical protein
MCGGAPTELPTELKRSIEFCVGNDDRSLYLCCDGERWGLEDVLNGIFRPLSGL